MTARDLVDRRANEHAPDEPTLRGTDITWRRIHVYVTPPNDKYQFEIWSYLGFDDAGELYFSTANLQDVVSGMDSLAHSFNDGLLAQLLRRPTPVDSCKPVYAWLRGGDVLNLPSARYECRWTGATKYVRKFDLGTNECVETITEI